MWSKIYSIVGACGIGYLFGVVFATRAITMSGVESSLSAMLLISGWMGLTFAVLFIPVGLAGLGLVTVYQRLTMLQFSRRTRTWFLSWLVLSTAIGIPFLGYYYSSGIQPHLHPAVNSAWDLVPLWLLRVGRWLGFSALTAAVCAFIATAFLVRLFDIPDADGGPVRSRRLIWVPVLIVLSWVVPPVWLHVARGATTATVEPAAAGKLDLAGRTEPPLGPVVVVAWDGATWDVIDPLLARGELPNLAALIGNGVRAPLTSYEPTLSPLIWTTVATGRRPGVHGVSSQVENRFRGMDSWFYFTSSMGFDRIFGPIWERLGIMDRVQVTSLARKSKAWWDIYGQAGLTVGLVNWRVSWPAESFPGFSVTDHLYLDFERALSESEPGQEPGSAGWDLEKACPSAIEPPVPFDLLDDALRAATERATAHARSSGLPRELAPRGEVFAQEVGMRLVGDRFPDLLAVYYYEIDAIEHKYWKYREPRFFFGVSEADAKEKGARIDEIYRFTDLLTGDLLARLPGDAIVILVSDHGHVPVFGEFRRSGAHAHAPPGVLVISGPGVRSGGTLNAASVYDIFPTVMYLSGLPVARELRGRVLLDAFDPELVGDRPVLEIESYGPREPVDFQERESPVNRDMLQRLRSLGYVG